MAGAADSSLTALSAVEQARLIREGRVSSVELTAAHLERIERDDPRVGAVVTLDADGALERARAADAVRDPARRGLLHGVPALHKDTANTRGMRTTFGHPLFAGNVPVADDLHVARMVAAGAVRMGKTNTPELAAGSHTTNRLFGPTRNPYDPGRSVGGSSGGAAAALACRFTAVADGSDMGGSLRNPASFCGVVGLRPTPGVVPNEEKANVFDPLGTAGPMGRTVADVALLLAVIGRPASVPRLSPRLDARALLRLEPAELRGLRVAFAPDLGGRVPVVPEVRAVLAETARTLERAGARVEEACPDLDGADEAFRTLRAAGFDDAFGDLLERRPDDFVDFLAADIRGGRDLTGRQVTRAWNEVTRLTRAAESFFADHDLVVAPAAQVLPFPIEWDWPHEVDGVPMRDYLEWMRAARDFTPLGVPAMSLPAGVAPGGLPVGAQLLTAAGEDVRLLCIALALEEAIGLPSVDPLAG